MTEAQHLRRQELTAKHHAREAAETLTRLEDGFPDNPEAMSYFYDLFRRTFCENEPVQTGPLVGTTCIQVPDELVRAAGGVPVRLCNGAHTMDQVGAEFMPSKSCPLVKATLGVLHSDLPEWLKGLKGVVNVTTCDQKRKAGSLMEEGGYAVHHLEIPPAKDSEPARNYWRESVRDFAKALPELTGGKLTRRSLRDAILENGRAQQAYRRFHRLRREKPALLLGKDAFLVGNAFFFDDLDRWTEAVEALVAELEQRHADGFSAAQKRAPRILFTGSPPVFPNLKVPLLIEQAGGVIVADETCSSNRMLYDAVTVDEWNLYDMVDAVADRYLKPCTCPIFTSDADRKRRLLEMAKEFQVDGVVYQTFAGCQVFEMEHRSINQTLDAAGIPSLYVETDYSPDDVGQLSTRVEAFIESLKTRRRRAR